jgi:hypothetical protein
MEHSHLGRCDGSGGVEPRGSTAAEQIAETIASNAQETSHNSSRNCNDE